LEICKGGPYVCIDATGFGYAKETIHKVERLLRLETDATSAFPIGALFDKGITFRAGVVCVQKYWKLLLKYIVDGKVDFLRRL
jgi:threonine dehydrogenase-like Zn-dependent dehydrogenase